jgi:hypothetical protein
MVNIEACQRRNFIYLINGREKIITLQETFNVLPAKGFYRPSGVDW